MPQQAGPGRELAARGAPCGAACGAPCGAASGAASGAARGAASGAASSAGSGAASGAASGSGADEDDEWECGSSTMFEEFQGPVRVSGFQRLKRILIVFSIYFTICQ